MNVIKCDILFALKHKDEELWLGSPFAGSRRVVDKLSRAAFYSQTGPLTQILHYRDDKDDWVIRSYVVQDWQGNI